METVGNANKSVNFCEFPRRKKHVNLQGSSWIFWHISHFCISAVSSTFTCVFARKRNFSSYCYCCYHYASLLARCSSYICFHASKPFSCQNVAVSEHYCCVFFLISAFFTVILQLFLRFISLNVVCSICARFLYYSLMFFFGDSLVECRTKAAVPNSSFAPRRVHEVKNGWFSPDGAHWPQTVVIRSIWCDGVDCLSQLSTLQSVSSGHHLPSEATGPFLIPQNCAEDAEPRFASA